MISSIFGKTKPVNFIIVLVFLFLFYWVVQFYLFNVAFPDIAIAPLILGIATLLLSVFVIDFVIKRNKLTGSNSYALLYFSLLFVVFPDTLGDSKAIFTTFFLMLAMRRLLSIKSLKDSKLKIFDAGLWICISSLFYEWALLYLLVVFAAIFIYEPKNIRNWLVIVSVGFSFFMIVYAVLVVLNKTSFLTSHYDFVIYGNAFNPTSWWISVKLAVYALGNIILAVWTFVRLSKAGMGKGVIMRLIALSFGIGLVVSILVASENTNAVMITFFPSVIFITNYLESIKKPRFLEFVLVLSIVAPILVFITNL